MLYDDVVTKMTIEECQAVLADILARAQVGNFDWDYDFYLALAKRVNPGLIQM